VLTLKILHYTDVHIRETNPPSRLGDYREDVFNKMRQVIEIARDNKVDLTTCGGDLFDNKKPIATRHSTVTELTGIYRQIGIPHYIVPGNHDLTGDNMETLSEQPLGVLLSSGVLIQMGSQVIKKQGLSVKLESHDFDENPNLSDFVVQGEEDASVLGIHIYASPKGGTLYGNTKVYSYQELSETGHDLYLLGHYHADNGVVTKDFGHGKLQTFVNVGSLTRGDYGDENLARTPKVCLITISKEGDSVTVETETFEISVRPNAETFDLVKKEKVLEQKEKASQFVTQLQESSEVIDTSDAITENLKVLAPDQAVLDEVMGLIAQADEELEAIKNNQRGSAKSKVKESDIHPLILEKFIKE
jgi:DNA repair protein SbcD/Mre11